MKSLTTYITEKMVYNKSTTSKYKMLNCPIEEKYKPKFK